MPQPAKILSPLNNLIKSQNYDFVEKIFTTLETYGSKYRAENLDIKPSHGDMQIIRNSDNMRACVELKTNHCTTDSRANPRTMTHMASSAQRMVFSWRQQYDWIVTGVTESPGHLPKSGFVINRDEIPRYWWNNIPTSNRLTWTPNDPTFLRRRRIHFTWDEEMAECLEDILQRHPSFNALLPIERKTIPLREFQDNVKPNVDDDDNSDIDSEDESDAEDEGQSEDEVGAGQKVRAAYHIQRVYDMRQGEWLMKLAAAA